MLCASAFVLNIDLCLLFMCLRLTFVESYTLGTAGVDIVGNWGFGYVIDLVWRVLLLLLLLLLLFLVYSGTLKLVGSHVVVEGVAAIYVLSCIARSVI